MRMNTNIPLAGNTPNYLGTIIGADQAAEQTKQAQFQNALNPLRKQEAELGIQQQQQQLELGGLQMQEIRRQAAAEAASVADKQALQREIAQAKRGLQMAGQALLSGDERAWTQVTSEFGAQGLPMDETGFEFLAAVVAGSEEGLVAAVRGPEQPDRKIMNVDGVAWDFTDPENPVRLTEPRERSPLVVIDNAGQAGAAGGLALPVSRDVPAGSGRAAFGASGVAGGIANRVSDFVTGTEVAPNIADNQRFFRSLEEQLLVNMAQAYPRQPSAALMDRLRRLAPNVGTWEGPEAATKELTLVEEAFQRDLSQATIRAQRGGGTASQQAELERQILALQSALEVVREAKRRMRVPEKEPDWMINTDPATWTEEQLQEAERFWGINQ